jgi:TatD DNase family protein
LYVGVTGWICDERRGTELQALVRDIPAERLLLETDAPYLLPRTLSPAPGSRRNEPRYLVEVLTMVARCCQKDPVALALQTTTNARRLFRLPG